MSPHYPFDDDEDSDTIDSFRLLHDETKFPEDIELETDSVPVSEDGIPLLDDVVSTPEEQVFGAPSARRPPSEDAVDHLAAVVRERLEAELGQIIAEVIDEALRPAVLDLETSLRGEIFEALRRRLGELIDEHVQRINPSSFDQDF
jgi:hypothetical protein